MKTSHEPDFNLIDDDDFSDDFEHHGDAVTSTDETTVIFVRHFLSGNLAGMSHKDSITFVSHDLAQGWIDGVKNNQAAGKLNWIFKRVAITAGTGETP